MKKEGKEVREVREIQEQNGMEVAAVVCFPKREIESVWGKPKLAIQYEYSCIPLDNIDEEGLREIMGLRVYARIVGYACGEGREMLAVEFVSGNQGFLETTRNRTGKYYMEISRAAPQVRGELEHSRYIPVYRDKRRYLHGFIGGISGGKMVDELPIQGEM